MPIPCRQLAAVGRAIETPLIRPRIGARPKMLVRQYFAATLPDWEDLYRRRTLYATIYQERLWAALALVDTLPIARRAHALDLGCGPGLGTAHLAKRGFSVHAADAQARMVALTLKRAGAEGMAARVSGSVLDIHALSFADATFDLVLVVGVSEWLDTLGAPIAEVARVLRPGGHLVLTADNSWALSCFLDPLLNPLVVPLKRALGRAVRRLWKTRRTLRTRAYSTGALDGALRRAGLDRTAGLTLGFGPFSFFNQGLLPDRLGHALHRRLQALADRGAPGLRSTGLVHVLAARK